jgi:hypothetical protein
MPRRSIECEGSLSQSLPLWSGASAGSSTRWRQPAEVVVMADRCKGNGGFLRPVARGRNVSLVHVVTRRHACALPVVDA